MYKYNIQFIHNNQYTNRLNFRLKNYKIALKAKSQS